MLLNVWATWCLPCRQEMPSIEALYRAMGPRGLRVVAVSVDAAGDARAIRDFVRGYGLSFEVLHAPGGTIQRAYQMSGVPETFLIGRDGVSRKEVYAAKWDTPANRPLSCRRWRRRTAEIPWYHPQPLRAQRPSVRIGVPVRLQARSTPPQPMSALHWGSSGSGLVSVSDPGLVLANAAAAARISVSLARDPVVRDSVSVVTLSADAP